MALTKQIEIKYNVANFSNMAMIKLFNSSGKEYTVSKTVSISSPPKGNATFSVGGTTATASLNSDKYSFMDLQNAQDGFGNWQLNYMKLRFTLLAGSTIPNNAVVITIDFKKAIDIDGVALYHTAVTDVIIRLIDENDNVKEALYTKEQMALDYPANKISYSNENNRTFTTPTKVDLDNKGSLPKILKALRKNGKLYFKPKK